MAAGQLRKGRNDSVILETEIWPNLYREAKCSGAALLVVNGRISDQALPSYQRWRWFFTRVLAQPDRILAQSEQDRERYLIAGAPAGHVSNAGNLKYDFEAPGEVAPAIQTFLDETWPESTWVAASSTRSRSSKSQRSRGRQQKRFKQTVPCSGNV